MSYDADATNNLLRRIADALERHNALAERSLAIAERSIAIAEKHAAQSSVMAQATLASMGLKFENADEQPTTPPCPTCGLACRPCACPPSEPPR